MKKRSIHVLLSTIGIILVILAVLFCFMSGSEQKEEVITRSADFDYDLLEKNLSLYELAPSQYTWLPIEDTPDVYATYYSIASLEEIGAPRNMVVPKYNDDFLVKISTNISEVFMLCELSTKYEWGPEAEQRLWEELEMYLKGDRFVIYKKEEPREEFDSNNIFATYYAAKALMYLDPGNLKNTISESMLELLLGYEDSLLHEAPDDILKAVNDAYQLIMIYEYTGQSTDGLLAFLGKYYEPYVLQLEKAISNEEIDIVFEMEAYWAITEKLDMEDRLSHLKWSELIDLLESNHGGYSLGGKEGAPDPLVTYLTLRCCNRYQCDYDMEKICRLILRHRGYDSHFTPYVLLERTYSSSFFAQRIMMILDEKKDGRASSDVDTNTLLEMGKESNALREEAMEIAQNVVDSALAADEITGGGIETLAYLIEEAEPEFEDAAFKRIMKSTISDYQSILEEGGKTYFLEALYVYYSLWGRSGIREELSFAVDIEPEFLSEAFALTRLLEAMYPEDSVLDHISQEQYDCITQVILDVYDPEWGFFFFNSDRRLATMESIYCGVYLADRFFVEPTQS